MRSRGRACTRACKEMPLACAPRNYPARTKSIRLADIGNGQRRTPVLGLAYHAAGRDSCSTWAAWLIDALRAAASACARVPVVLPMPRTKSLSAFAVI